MKMKRKKESDSRRGKRRSNFDSRRKKHQLAGTNGWLTFGPSFLALVR